MKTYFHNLDGLRFFAFLSVFISHIVLFLGYHNESLFFTKFKQLFLVQGDLGVNFFFVLSGFLITYLLFQEIKKSSTIKLSSFYMRRILRIWPIYFIVIILGFFIIPPIAKMVGGDFPFSTLSDVSVIPWYLLFVANISMTFQNAPNIFVAVLWSISVEEQFYLIWPLLMKKFSHKTFGYIILFIILVSFFGRLPFVYHYGLSQYFTISVMSALAVGAGLAYCVEYTKIKKYFIKISRRKIVLLYILIFSLVPFKGALSDIFIDGSYRFLYAIIPLVFSILFALVIAEQNYCENSLFKIGKKKILTYLGKISYGLYAYHLIAVFIVLSFVKTIGLHTKYTNLYLYFTIIISSFLLTILISHLSYKYIEKRFLKLKEKFTV